MPLLLPPRTQPATDRIRRRHEPRLGSYGLYRDCLRWEFGFTCAFCLVHEADLVAHGVTGSGLTGIEHHRSRRDFPAEADRYDNCFYACRYCNQARGRWPHIDGSGRRLLEPCAVAWGERFHLHDHALVPSDTDPDAVQTADVYDLNDPRRVTIRADRAESMEAATHALDVIPDLITDLLRLAEDPAQPPSRARLAAAGELRTRLQEAKETLRRFAAVPSDAPADCRCGVATVRRLPDHVVGQCFSWEDSAE